MFPRLVATAFLTLAGALLLSTPAFSQLNDLDTILRFEPGEQSNSLGAWRGFPPLNYSLDSLEAYNGANAARLQNPEEGEGGLSYLMLTVPLDVEGKELQLKGFLKTEGVAGFAGLMMRQDGNIRGIRSENMASQKLKGTTDWIEYSITLPIASNAYSLTIGANLSGKGTLWIDDLQLFVDGVPYSEAPKKETALTRDTEFDEGSGISLSSLRENQIEHLALLGKVWGFLKYHHPDIAAGNFHWDYELFRILPAVLEADSFEESNQHIEDWIRATGIPTDCTVCAKPPENVHLLPDIDWIEDTNLLGKSLSDLLRHIHKNRYSGDDHFYIAKAPNVGNPIFRNEPVYASQKDPDSGYRILALFRKWNMIEYWFPYRNQIDDNWTDVLHTFLPRLVEAPNRDAYRLELMAFASLIKDTHVNLWAERDVLPPQGECYLPVGLRFVEGRLVVMAYTDSVAGPASQLNVGDVITHIDGEAIEDLVAERSPYYSASNRPTRLRDISRFIPRGPCAASNLTIERADVASTVNVKRLPVETMPRLKHDRPGDTFQLLSPDIAYIKLSSIQSAHINDYLKQAEHTKGMVIDIRNYPSEFVVFSLGSRLIKERTPFVMFTSGDVNNPGAFLWRDYPIALQPASSGYKGKVAILVDEVSQSQAEYTAMAFRTAPDAVVVGSTTAGADGNVSAIPLPGAMRSLLRRHRCILPG